MKKQFLTLLMAGVMTMSCCGTWVSAANEQEAVLVEDGTEEETLVKSYLTGLDVPESIGRKRPIAVMMNNIEEGCPQSGIANAGVVYEAPVEGEITRLMAILEDYEDLERIGSVRSCRDYYIFYANEFDALYSHYGQAAYALPYFEQHLIDNINGLTLGDIAYYRSTDRVAPHNAYTNYKLLQNGIDYLGYRRDYKEDYDGHYLFAPEGQETTLDNGIDAKKVTLGNFTYNDPWFEYDEETKKYKRFQYEEPQIDELTEEQLTCDNIILQYSSCPPYDANGYLNIDAITGGKGKYITRGKAIDIRWEKDSPWGVTHYISTEEQEIRLNPGTTWVEIIQDDRTDAVTYQ